MPHVRHRLKSEVQRHKPKVKKALTKKITIARWEFNAFGFACITLGIIIGTYGVLSGVIPGIRASSDLTATWSFGQSGLRVEPFHAELGFNPSCLLRYV